MNVEHFEQLPIRVAITGADGSPAPGFGLDESEVEIRLDKPYAAVRWRDRSDLSALRGKSLSLRFEVRGAALYAFRFADNG